MSTQKEKYLVSAQKYIQKGQFDRALRDYEQIVAADPKDVKHRQKLAELMVRCNRREEAVREYETIAKYFDENGFYLKAIAVYKQIQRLDPANMDVCLSLAQLNEKQGMIGNALSEYKVIFDHYDRDGNLTEAIKILEKMQAVDPDNVEIRLKLAETLYSADCADRAYSEFSRVAVMLRSRTNTEFADRVTKRIEKLFPERGDSSLNQLAEQIASGGIGEALPKVRQLLEQDPDNPRLLGLLGDACRQTGDWATRRSAMEKLLQVLPDDPHAVQGLVESIMASGDHGAAVEAVIARQGVLIGAGHVAALERYLTELLAQSPYDVRLLEALRDLYERSGDVVKLADITASLTILSRPAETGDSGAGSADGVDLAAAAAEAEEFSWGDELDLSTSPPAVPEVDPTVAGAGSAEYNLVDLASPAPDASVAAADGFEIDISFDLPDGVEVFTPGDVAAEPETPAVSLSGDPGQVGDMTSAAPWGDELDLAAQGDFPGEESAETALPVLEDFGAVDLLAEEAVSAQASPDVTPASGPEDMVDISFDLDSDGDIFAQADDGDDQPTVMVDRDLIAPIAADDSGGSDQDLQGDSAAPSFSRPAVPDQLEAGDELLLEEALITDVPELELTAVASEESPIQVDSPFVPPTEAGPVAASGKYAFDGLFTRFKEGLDQQVASDDTETHYDLGIAYMEMGLFDDAIKEFLIAATDPRRTLDCLTLQGVCCRDKGDLETAEQCFSAGLSIEGLDTDRILSLRYELALLYQVAGRRDAALQTFREVFAVNPGFRDTMQRIAQLSGTDDSFDLSDLADADLELEPLE